MSSKDNKYNEFQNTTHFLLLTFIFCISMIIMYILYFPTICLAYERGSGYWGDAIDGIKLELFTGQKYVYYYRNCEVRGKGTFVMTDSKIDMSIFDGHRPTTRQPYHDYNGRLSESDF